MVVDRGASAGTAAARGLQPLVRRELASGSLFKRQGFRCSDVHSATYPGSWRKKHPEACTSQGGSGITPLPEGSVLKRSRGIDWSQQLAKSA
jgi:hypothetical protein